MLPRISEPNPRGRSAPRYRRGTGSGPATRADRPRSGARKTRGILALPGGKLGGSILLALLVATNATAQVPKGEGAGGLPAGFHVSGTTPGLVIDDTPWVWDGDLDTTRVRVPVRLFAGERVNFVQFSIDFDDEWLEYNDFNRSSSDWFLSSLDPIVHDDDESLVRGVLYRRGGIARAPAGEGEHLFDLIFDVNVEALPADTYHRHAAVSFTTFDPGSLTQNPAEETILGDLDGDDEVGSVDLIASILEDGGVDIYYADGLEIGSGALTNRAQRLVLPVYATRIAAREERSLTIGVDYDELILRTHRVRGIGRAGGESGEPRSVEIAPRSNGRGVTFRLTLSADSDGNGRTPLLREHVADLELDFHGDAATDERPAGSALTILPISENDRPGDVASVSVPGQLEILPPWFVRGNVDSSIDGSADGDFPYGDRTITETASIQPQLRDGLSILQFLFNSAENPETGLSCLEAADANGDGQVHLDDSVLILNYLYIGGQEPVAPFPGAGVAPSDSGLGCERPLPVFERR